MDVNGPLRGRTIPIRTVSWAWALPHMSKVAKMHAAMELRIRISSSLMGCLFCSALGWWNCQLRLAHQNGIGIGIDPVAGLELNGTKRDRHVVEALHFE